jgi:hypothetical protein
MALNCFCFSLSVPLYRSSTAHYYLFYLFIIHFSFYPFVFSLSDFFSNTQINYDILAVVENLDIFLKIFKSPNSDLLVINKIFDLFKTSFGHLLFQKNFDSLKGKERVNFIEKFNNFKDTIYDKYNRSGYLIQRGKYYIFQPYNENEDVPMYYRETTNINRTNQITLENFIKQKFGNVKSNLPLSGVCAVTFLAVGVSITSPYSSLKGLAIISPTQMKTR